MRIAVIDGENVVNVIEAEPGFELPGFLLVAAGAAGPGWRYIDGEFVAPDPEPESVPQSVTRAQGKAALIQAGLWPAVLAYVQGITDPTQQALAEVALHDTLEWQRASPFLNAAAAELNMTDKDLDDLFRAASAIEL